MSGEVRHWYGEPFLFLLGWEWQGVVRRRASPSAALGLQKPYGGREEEEALGYLIPPKFWSTVTRVGL